MKIFNSYVTLPEGTHETREALHRFSLEHLDTALLGLWLLAQHLNLKKKNANFSKSAKAMDLPTAGQFAHGQLVHELQHCLAMIRRGPQVPRVSGLKPTI